jgi:hypothetical protein
MRYLVFLTTVALSGCSASQDGDYSAVDGVRFEGEVDIRLLNELIVSDVIPGTLLSVDFYYCDTDLCAAAYVDGAIETPYGDVFGETVIQGVTMEDDELDGELTYNDETFYLAGDLLGNELSVTMFYPFIFEHGIIIGDFSLTRVSEQELQTLSAE